MTVSRLSALSPLGTAGGRTGGEIVSLYLLPAYWRRGIGALLLKAAMARLRQRGFSDICLWVAEENSRARRFYETQGFVLAPERTSTVLDGETVREARYIHTLRKEGEA